MKKAAKNNLTKGNPAADATPPKVEDVEVECLEWADVKRLLAYLEAAPDGKPKPMYVPALLAATTGMRRGEILGLRWSDVDFGRNAYGQFTVAQSLEQTKAGIAVQAAEVQTVASDNHPSRCHDGGSPAPQGRTGGPPARPWPRKG